jgi:hypothetical protein
MLILSISSQFELRSFNSFNSSTPLALSSNQLSYPKHQLNNGNKTIMHLLCLVCQELKDFPLELQKMRKINQRVICFHFTKKP